MNQLCVVCQDAPIDHMITPCNHVCLCSGCSTHIKTCPICNGQKGSIIKLFYAGIPNDIPVAPAAPAIPAAPVAPADPVAPVAPAASVPAPVAYRAQSVNWSRESHPQKVPQPTQVFSREFHDWLVSGGYLIPNQTNYIDINYINNYIKYIDKYPYYKKFY